MNFRQWVQRAEAFTHELIHSKENVWAEICVKPPATKKQLAQVEEDLVNPLPPAFKEFLAKGSAHCSIRYSWRLEGAALEAQNRIYNRPGDSYSLGNGLAGGARVCSVADLVGEEGWLQQHAEMFGESSKLHQLLQGGIPFCVVGNGDSIVLDVDDDEDEPRVCYVNHEEPKVAVIAATLEEFLEAWEQVCYIGPEIWFLKRFFNPKTRLLDGASKRAVLLRQLFDVEC